MIKLKKKLILSGAIFKKKLLEHVDAANLPEVFGGTCTCAPYGCIYSNAGPWNKEGKVEMNMDVLKTTTRTCKETR